MNYTFCVHYQIHQFRFGVLRWDPLFNIAHTFLALHVRCALSVEESAVILKGPYACLDHFEFYLVSNFYVLTQLSLAYSFICFSNQVWTHQKQIVRRDLRRVCVRSAQLISSLMSSSVFKTIFLSVGAWTEHTFTFFTVHLTWSSRNDTLLTLFIHRTLTAASPNYKPFHS